MTSFAPITNRREQGNPLDARSRGFVIRALF